MFDIRLRRKQNQQGRKSLYRYGFDLIITMGIIFAVGSLFPSYTIGLAIIAIILTGSLF